ncbi:unnamed protein product [Ectocarpus sp. 6 AP-2014]
METIFVGAVDGVVDCSELAPVGSSIELELNAPAASTITVINLHTLAATDITIGSSMSYSLSEPIELPADTVSYTGPVMDKMFIPRGLKSLTVVETPNSGLVSRIDLPPGLESLHIRLTGVFSPVDEMNLPSGLAELKVQGEHNCSLEKLEIPPSLTLLDTGTSVQPVDRLRISLGDIRVVSKSTRLVIAGDDSDNSHSFKDHLILTSSLPVVSRIHELLPSLINVSVVLDQATWQTVGDVWTNLLLEGRVHVQNLIIINSADNHCMRDFGEVLYRSGRLRRPLCQHLHVIGETFSYATILRVSNAVRTYSGDLVTELDFMSPFPKCVLHRVASVLGADIRDGHLAYHSQDVNVEFRVRDETLSLRKRIADEEDYDHESIDHGSICTSEIEIEQDVGVVGVKPIILHTWNECGFCKKQDDEIQRMFADTKGDIADRFEKLVTVKRVAKPAEVDDDRVTAFPTWVVSGVLSPGFKQASEILELLSRV